MDNAEEILQALEEFSKLKPKEIPKELDEYLGYVAKTGDPVFQWHLVKHLFHEKLLNVITEFYETSPTIDLPPCPNVVPFNYERMRTSLLERLDTFASAPFTVQRICELLTNPRKQYNRVDKFMRAVEKNILVVSTREPGAGKRLESDQTETVLNGIPDSKIKENTDRINVCPDNVQFNNSTESHPAVPVENAVNAGVIQEEIEIANTASSTVISTESKSWCEVSNDVDHKKDPEDFVKTDSLVNSNEINVVSTTSTSSVQSEIPKNNIVFAEGEGDVKQDNLDNIKHIADSICSDPIDSSTPDSPDSPERSSSETCEASDEGEILMSEKTASDESTDGVKKQDYDVQQSEEIITSEIEDLEENKILSEESTEMVETTESTPVEPSNNITEVSPIIEDSTDNANQELENDKLADELKIQQPSPENTQPDSSNDSYLSSGDNVTESNVDLQIETITQDKDIDLAENTETSASIPTEQTAATEVSDVTSSQITETNEENTSDKLVIKEVEEPEAVGEIESEDSQKSEEVNCSSDVVTENIIITSEDAVASSDDCVSIEEIEEKENIDDNSNETVGSSNEVLEESCDQERREGSIIHATSSITEIDQTVSTIEDICVDQSSCGVEEEEAMEVDESSNQQMITSENETEVEPMDQSEQLQS